MGRSNGLIGSVLLSLTIAACFVAVMSKTECLAEADGSADDAAAQAEQEQVQKLIQKLKGSNARIRRAAAEALVKIGRPAVDPLTEARKDADGVAREAIDFVLKKIGKLIAWPPPQPRCTLQDDPTQEYFAYVPKDFDPKRTYWIFVSAHGLGGNGSGALGFAGFAHEAKCIVVAPSFKQEHQFPSRGTGKILLNIIDEISKACKVRRKVFVTGMSAGGQFAHRFALENPELVVGCAAHSPGSWDSPNKKAENVPFLVTCGEADTTRIGIAKRFVEQAKAKGYRYVKSAWFPNVGHAFCGEAVALTKEHYRTAITGLTPDERKQAQADLDKAGKLIDEDSYGPAFKVLKKVAAFPQKSVYTERASKGFERIERIGSQKIAEIEKLSVEDFREALARLDRLRQQFEATPVADAIAQARRKIMKRPDVVAEQQKEKDAQRAKKLYEAAEKLLAQERYPAALDKLRVAAELAHTAYGAKAATKIKEIEADPTAARTKASKECRRLLMMARNYLANELPELARPNLERIIKNYPDSEEAKIAREMLKEENSKK
ncbi:MAG: dienelactone hydrolase family protein [Planctomycetes bacterium]|nr:dienelactone hydrolase family protein [Planctomycetota bacterium]